MMQIRSADNELDIQGTNQEFMEFKSAIKQVTTSSNQTEVVIQCDEEVDPSPYTNSCKQLQVQLGSGPNQFIVVDTTLKIIGSPAALNNLSENLPIKDGEYQDNIHYHYDAYSFPDYVSSNSPEITLSLRQDIC